jgi:hypothetical protein
MRLHSLHDQRKKRGFHRRRCLSRTLATLVGSLVFRTVVWLGTQLCIVPVDVLHVHHLLIGSDRIG